MTDLQAITADLETLYEQDIFGDDDVDQTIVARVLAARLDDSDWLEIATQHWECHYVYELETFLSWIHDSPIWWSAL